MSFIRAVVLFAESLLFTIIVPGTVTIWLPAQLLARRGLGWPIQWGMSHWAGLFLGAIGVGAYLWCLWHFAVTGRGIPAPLDHPKRLVVRGLYRYVRNPMYLSVLMILLGEVLVFQSRALLIYALAWLLLMHLVVLLYEEPNLRRRFGEPYAQYTSAVRRWLPGRRYTEAA